MRFEGFSIEHRQGWSWNMTSLWIESNVFHKGFLGAYKRSTWLFKILGTIFFLFCASSVTIRAVKLYIWSNCHYFYITSAIRLQPSDEHCFSFENIVQFFFYLIRKNHFKFIKIDKSIIKKIFHTFNFYSYLHTRQLRRFLSQ